MPRPKSLGIEYFPFDVDFFSDKKIKILKSRYGADGIAVYIYILCQIYREGYFIRVDEDFKFMISDDLHMATDKVEQVMTFLFGRSMFNEQLLKSDAIITSTGIQKRWQEAVKTRAAKTPIKVDDRYWLLKESETRPFIKVTHFNSFSEKNEGFSEKNEGFSEKNDIKESKVKESKVKESNVVYSARTRANDDGTSFSERDSLRQESEANLQAFNRFVEKWGIQTRALRNYSGGKLAGIDWDAISKWVMKSDYLQKQKSVSFYIDHADEILDGKYFDYVKPRGSPKSDSRSQSKDEDGYIDPDYDWRKFENIHYD